MADQPKITITEITVEHPQGFGGHEFEYRDADDLFACVQCGGYEIPLRRPDGSIQECPVSLSLAGKCGRCGKPTAADFAQSLGGNPQWDWIDPNLGRQCWRVCQACLPSTEEIEKYPTSEVSGVSKLGRELLTLDGRCALCGSGEAYVFACEHILDDDPAEKAKASLNDRTWDCDDQGCEPAQLCGNRWSNL